MKKTLTLLLAGVITVGAIASLVSCKEEEEKEPESGTVTITCLNENAVEVEKEVPYKPERVAVLDYAVLDMMDVFGVGDKVVSSAEGTIDYLSAYWEKIDNGTIANLGNLKDYSMEVLQQSEPDIIFIGGRQSANYAAIEQIAPVVYLTVSAGSLVEDTQKNARTIASIFGIDESVVDEQFTSVQSRIDALKAIAQPAGEDAKTCMVLMYTSESSISALASDGRCSLISNEIGFNLQNITTDDSSNNSGAGGGGYHGSSLSFETIAGINPDYIFVLNRGYITSSGSTTNNSVKEVITNKVTEGTNAAQEGHIIVMANPDAWYTAEGGINALLTMLSDLESELIG